MKQAKWESTRLSIARTVSGLWILRCLGHTSRDQHPPASVRPVRQCQFLVARLARQHQVFIARQTKAEEAEQPARISPSSPSLSKSRPYPIWQLSFANK